MYCPECGTKNLDEARFCKECGTRLIDSSITASSKKFIQAGSYLLYTNGEKKPWMNKLVTLLENSRENEARQLVAGESEKNDPYALLAYGHFMETGLGVDENEDHAFELWNRASKLGNIEADWKIAEYYFSRDKVEEYKGIISSAMEAGSHGAIFYFIGLLYKGLQSNSNPLGKEELECLVDDALRDGFTPALIYKAGITLESGDRDKAIECLEQFDSTIGELPIMVWNNVAESIKNAQRQLNTSEIVDVM